MISRYQQLPPAYRLTLPLAFILIVAFFAAVGSLYFNSHAQTQRLGDLVVKQAAANATADLITNDQVGMNVLVSNLVAHQSIATATIYSVDGEVLAEAKQPQGQEAQNPFFSAPISYQDVTAGYVRVSLNQAIIDHPLSQSLTWLGLCFLALVVALLLFAHRYGNRLLKSVLSMPKINEPSPQKSEILTEGPIAQEQTKGTVIVLHCQNFQQLNRCLNPREVQELLHSQLQAVEAGVNHYQGKLNFTAEGNAYVLFSSLQHKDYSFRALCCALLIRDLIKEVLVPTPARFHFGLGIALAIQGHKLWPGSSHPALSDSACSEALTLATYAKQDTLALSLSLHEKLQQKLGESLHTSAHNGSIEVKGLSGHYDKALIEQLNEILDELENSDGRASG